MFLTSWSLSFAIKQIDGPWGCISALRSLLLRSAIGPFFYKLIECNYCLGFHTSLISYILLSNNLSIRDAFTYSFSGAIFVMLLSSILERIRS